MSELQFIRHLKAFCPPRPPVTVGIGDDGAVIDISAAHRQVVVADMLLDGVHFDLQATDPELIGRKALTVNLSDLAAMGCRPVAAFVSIAIPRSLKSASFLHDLYRGLQETADTYELCIAGGDTNRWSGSFAISVTVTGHPICDNPVLRSTAEPGNALYVTGPLGGSLPSGRHLTFSPQLKNAAWLVQNLNVRAMMDISDGLSLDLLRMMEASGTGAQISGDAIPIHPDVSADLSHSERLAHAMNDGEDFELLLAIDEADSEVALPAGLELVHIGDVTDQPGVLQMTDSSGEVRHIEPAGWQHL